MIGSITCNIPLYKSLILDYREFGIFSALIFKYLEVAEQPEPMKEISFWDIDAPHLDDYFVSKQGQFKLTELPNGNTLLEGTTWYYHNIQPTFYWQLWSDYIIHKIHNRVLTHIKKNAETENNKNTNN